MKKYFLPSRRGKEEDKNRSKQLPTPRLYYNSDYENEHPVSELYYDRIHRENVNSKDKNNNKSASSYTDPQDIPRSYLENSFSEKAHKNRKNNNYKKLTEEQKEFHNQRIEQYQNKTENLVKQRKRHKEKLSLVLIMSSIIGAAYLYISAFYYNPPILILVPAIALICGIVAFGAALGIVTRSLAEIANKTNVLR